MLAWLLIPTGIVIIVKAAQIGDFVGEIDFAEKYLGSGGTYSFIKLFGLAVTIFSMMWLTGDLPSFLQGTLGRFFGNPQ
jgi:hypothetical protein